MSNVLISQTFVWVYLFLNKTKKMKKIKQFISVDRNPFQTYVI